jgi:hypothetical protein
MGALATLAGDYTWHEGGWEELEAVIDLASSLVGPGKNCTRFPATHYIV